MLSRQVSCRDVTTQALVDVCRLSNLREFHRREERRLRRNTTQGTRQLRHGLEQQPHRRITRHVTRLLIGRYLQVTLSFHLVLWLIIQSTSYTPNTSSNHPRSKPSRHSYAAWDEMLSFSRATIPLKSKSITRAGIRMCSTSSISFKVPLANTPQDHFFMNLPLRDRLREESLIRLCTRKLTLIYYYYMFIDEKYEGYPLSNPYWTIINPIQRLRLQLWKKHLTKDIEREMVTVLNIKQTSMECMALMEQLL